MSCGKPCFRNLTLACVAAGFASGISTALADEPAGASVGPELAARQVWREYVIQNSAPEEGCYQTSYPNYFWEKSQCKVATNLHFHPVARARTNSIQQVAGNGNDWVLRTPGGLILVANVFFNGTTGVTSETGVGVPAFGGGGILGPNEYSIQLNTNFRGTTAACAGHSGCTVWNQFIYATDFPTRGEAGVFMESWLLGWGFTACPSGFQADGAGDCFINSPIAAAPNEPIASLSGMVLTAWVRPGGNLQFAFSSSDGTSVFTAVVKDAVNIAEVWNEAEANVVGDAGGSQAVFNPGSSVRVRVMVDDGNGFTDSLLPTCVANAGSTGETNNLNLGPCTVPPFPHKQTISFIESN